MKTNSDYARIITAAHRGSQLAQQAVDVIAEVRSALAKSCDEHYIIRPTDYGRSQIYEVLAGALLAASPWLQGIADSQGLDARNNFS